MKIGGILKAIAAKLAALLKKKALEEAAKAVDKATK